MAYADGFLIAIPRKNVAAYKKMAQLGAKVWMEHGALQYFETVGDDLNVKGVVPFTKVMKTKPNETVILAWIVYKSRAHRDSVNKKVMKDPRMKLPEGPMPFDMKKMVMGGFTVIVEK